ncbi:aminotransferase class I/II-fold pyridoxal phosphate-dependent enzyme [Ruminococcaceae bacterium OttesenSCG-928-O06]|nr:aminotransferase class I/II-fold pyridoxal phosphate-dependent enzyme [Ruminococcaceae bacterium OttesenSCG-928-O06]
MLPFHRPHIAKNQSTYVEDALRCGPLQGDGPYTQKVCEALRALTGAKGVLLTPSASGALELCFWQMDGADEVLLPAYNFPSAASAVLRGGGKVVLCDIDPATQNMDAEDAAARITKNTRAICLTHYAGIACDMDAFLALAATHGLLLAEDAAHAIGATYKGRALGAIGQCGCISFHATKNVTCGEGGAYLQRQANPAWDAAQMRRQKGTNRRAFEAGEVEYYSWQTVGTSLLLPEVCAAQLLAQLEELKAITAARCAAARRYDEMLAPLYAKGALLPMHTPGYAGGNGHIYYIRCPGALAQRQKVQAHTAAQGAPCLPHFVPLHLGAMGAALGYKKGDFPHSEHAADSLLRLPMFAGITAAQQATVCAALAEVAG